jgi:hypothetical protein
MSSTIGYKRHLSSIRFSIRRFSLTFHVVCFAHCSFVVPRPPLLLLLFFKKSIGGALLALAFCIPFNPIWSLENSDVAVGMHFFFSLLVYESLFSYVMVAHTALLADITNISLEREKCNLYGALMGSFGSLSVFIGQFW